MPTHTMIHRMTIILIEVTSNSLDLVNLISNHIKRFQLEDVIKLMEMIKKRKVKRINKFQDWHHRITGSRLR